MNHEQVIERVKKLLALSTSPNEHEAAQAAALASKLMAKYAIDEAVLREPTADDIVDEELMGPQSRAETWRGVLSNSLAIHHRCKTIWIPEQNGSFKTFALRIVGKKSDIESVRYLWSYCCREIGRLCESRKGTGRTAMNSYRLGVVDGVVEQMNKVHREAREEAIREHGEKGKMALVRLDEQRTIVLDLFGRFYPLAKNRAAPDVNIDREAYRRGVQDGKRIELGKGKGLTSAAMRLGDGK